MKKYNNIDGLRIFACLGIVLLHVKINMVFDFEYSLFNNIFQLFSLLSSLFMIISSFGMCCGYYQKIKENSVSINEFYKILPIFIVVVLIDIISERNSSSIIEKFADLTLMFGFLPKKLEVIGVA